MNIRIFYQAMRDLPFNCVYFHFHGINQALENKDTV